jgi:hypothetical protein
MSYTVEWKISENKESVLRSTLSLFSITFRELRNYHV